MGKKTRRERAQKRDSFANQRKTQKRKSLLIAVGVFAVVGVIVGYSIYVFATTDGKSPDTPPGAGAFNDEHEHASILVKIHNDPFDFSAAAYQIQSNWIHFEAQDGTTVHRHSSGVTMGDLFESLGIELDDQCYIFPNGRQFCADEEYSLKFYINGEVVESITDYVPDDEDRILISYGGETPEEIQQQLDELDAQPIIA